jgi:hypothetical protein
MLTSPTSWNGVSNVARLDASERRMQVRSSGLADQSQQPRGSRPGDGTVGIGQTGALRSCHQGKTNPARVGGRESERTLPGCTLMYRLACPVTPGAHATARSAPKFRSHRPEDVKTT